MASISEHSPSTTVSRGFFSKIFGGIGASLILIAERDTRYRKIQHLQAKTDAELAAIGLKRDDIVRHVYTDLMYL